MNKNLHRIFLAVAFTGAGLLATLPTANAQATVPAQQKTQVPGYYRMQLGDFEVTALYDGYVQIDNKVIKGINAEDAKSLLNKMFLDSTNGVQTAVNAYLVNTGSNLILVDSGAAKCFGPTMGNIKSNITASGYQPEQVDTILLTHLHPDHACGVSNQDKMVFPNATVYVAKADADYWLSSEIAAKAPADAKPMFKLAQDAIAPYKTANKFKTYHAGDALVPGVKIIPTPGHTPGHTSYLFSSGEHNLLIWGDIVHSHSIQFAQPEVAMEFDTDSKQAIETRKILFANVAENKLWIGGAHLPFPGLGHVGTEGKGYKWIPIEYSPIIQPQSK
ncbi:MBL fold metallo-hydrolase [Pragia fontium]|uniref:MBL fold metallo-hydrolase n=1 Tax=Pragia fontium TaxID=82985 RepID=A0ABQ5LM52_9GAMM|nr:MBL fold metallo-hydrolase [Pragia fontium]GKX64708.1 MBL fold metallo-hydrolase [Pragia fontium]